MSATITRSVGRWHGGKYKLAPWIIQQFPHHKCYVEPFGGMASVLMQKPRSYAEVYNDLDGEAVNLFRVLRGDLSSQILRQQLELTPFSRKEFDLAYEPTKEPIERARRFLIKSLMGHGSDGASAKHRTGFRSNTDRPSTIPAHDWVSYPQHLESFCNRLRGVIIECEPAADVIDRYDGPNTLHYIDPPYMLETRSERAKRSPAYRHELTDDDHRALLMQLRQVRGMVVLSGYDAPLYRDLLGDWETIQKGSRDDAKNQKIELLWLNPAAASQQLRLL